MKKGTRKTTKTKKGGNSVGMPFDAYVAPKFNAKAQTFHNVQPSPLWYSFIIPVKYVLYDGNLRNTNNNGSAMSTQSFQQPSNVSDTAFRALSHNLNDAIDMKLVNLKFVDDIAILLGPSSAMLSIKTLREVDAPGIGMVRMMLFEAIKQSGWLNQAALRGRIPYRNKQLRVVFAARRPEDIVS